jgi:hypothetical protein
MSGPLLLPVPFSSKAVVIGQLLSNPLDPYSISLASPIPHISVQTSTQHRYETTLSRDISGRLLSTESFSSHDNIVVLQAESSETLSLKYPTKSFDTLCQDVETQAFLREAALNNKTLYFVTGIQTLNNCVFKEKEGEEGNSKIPTDNNIRRDSGTNLHQQEASSDMILGIELRKVKARVGTAEEPHPVEDVTYVWSYHQIDQGLQLSIGLGKALDQRELRSMAGIVEHEESEVMDVGCVIHDSGDEGLGGF